jgi:predicted nucleic acid-binding protein
MRRDSSLTSESVVFDSWAWWEVVRSSALGDRLARRYLERTEAKVMTVDYTLAEIAAELAVLGLGDQIASSLSIIERGSDVLSISVEVAELAASLRSELRRTDRNASLSDAVVLATARNRGAILISGDPCYAGQRDVRAS